MRGSCHQVRAQVSCEVVGVMDSFEVNLIIPLPFRMSTEGRMSYEEQRSGLTGRAACDS